MLFQVKHYVVRNPNTTTYLCLCVCTRASCLCGQACAYACNVCVCVDKHMHVCESLSVCSIFFTASFERERDVPDGCLPPTACVLENVHIFHLNVFGGATRE